MSDEPAEDGLHEITGVLSLGVDIRGHFTSRAEFRKAVTAMWMAVSFKEAGYAQHLDAEDNWEGLAIISGGEGTTDEDDEDDEDDEEESVDEAEACYHCGAPALIAGRGTIYVRREVAGRWQNVAICTACWDRENPGRPAARVLDLESI